MWTKTTTIRSAKARSRSIVVLASIAAEEPSEIDWGLMPRVHSRSLDLGFFSDAPVQDMTARQCEVRVSDYLVKGQRAGFPG